MSESRTDPTAGHRQPIHLQWKDIRYEVTEGQGDERHQKTILHGISGQVAPGKMCAIMGPSGSGKTTLLNVLARRVLSGVSGEIIVNGQPPPRTLKRLSGYVLQNEEFFATLTVKEYLYYAAELRLPESLTKEQKAARVEEVIDELDLQKCKDTYIGEIGSGISGGERRRLAIGLEIISHPSLLLLDEPTSGLDSASAQMVVNSLRKLSDKGQTIICTIHQPRFSVLKKFDSLCLLGLGKVVFFGQVSDSLNFLKENGHECPAYENPADFMLDLINTRQVMPAEEQKKPTSSEQQHTSSQTELPQTEIDVELGIGAQRSEIISELSASFAKSSYAKATTIDDDVQLPPPVQVDDDKVYVTSVFHQTKVIFQRSFYHKLREPAAAMTQAFNAIVLPFIIGTVYWQLPHDINGARDRLSALSLVVLLQSFMAYDILLLFPIERHIYLKEQEGGLYRTSAYYFGRTGAEFPLHTFFAVCTATVVYFTMGFQNDTERFFTFVVIVVVATLTGASLLLLLSAVSKALEQSNILATLMIVIFMLFDGNWLSLDNIPAAYNWIHHISFMGYAVGAAIKNEIEGQVFTCTTCPVQVLTGAEFLEQNGFASVDVWFNIGMMVLISVITRFFAYFALRFMHTGKTFKERLEM